MIGWYTNLMLDTFEPHNVHDADNIYFQFYFKYLLQKTFALFKFTLPNDWKEYGESYFKYILFLRGFIAICKTEKFGVIPQHCTLSGYGVFYQPTRALIVNPFFQMDEPLNGDKIGLIRLSPDYTGVGDIISGAASLLANAHGSIPANFANSKTAAVFASSNQNIATSFKALYDEIQNGNPAVFAHKNLFKNDGELNFQMFNNNVKNTFIVPELLETMKQIEQWYFSFIGLPNVNNPSKKERMSVDEVNKNDTSTKCLLDVWLEQLQSGIDFVNKKFSLDLSVEQRYKDIEVSDNDSKKKPDRNTE